MKKKLAIYLSAFFMLFAGISCSMSDGGTTVVLSPYAMISSFSIGDIKSSYPDFTSTGEDTTVVRTISTSAYPFTINQLDGEIFNVDSLPFSTDVSKVVMTLTVNGSVAMYIDSLGTYEYFSTSDSIDFTTPRLFRVYAADGSHHKDYTVTVNVHKVEPELMAWSKYQSPVGVIPAGIVEFKNSVYLFGTAADGSLALAVSPLDSEPVWESLQLNGLPATADVAYVQQFAGSLFVVAEGDVYVSDDAANWTAVLQGVGAIAFAGASDSDEKIWLSTEQGLMCSNDGVNFVVVEDTPDGFPMYGVSTMSYPLLHNANITRYMVIGYANPEMEGDVVVWSHLSSENGWVRYDNEKDYSCPSLKGLRVLRYDSKFYAFGGAGIAAGMPVMAFGSFYISKDNGIVWKACEDFYQRLPKELLGDNAQFAAFADSNNYIWIVTDGVNGGVWKGIINRLGFEK